MSAAEEIMAVVVCPGWRYRAGTDTVTVNRVARDQSWADIRVTQPHGATWTKRMPLPLPADWEKLP